MQVDSPNFGTTTALQTAEGAGPRNFELTRRIIFLPRCCSKGWAPVYF
jgi:hypothetical protein